MRRPVGDAPVDEDDVELAAGEAIAHGQDLVVVGHVKRLELDAVRVFGRQAVQRRSGRPDRAEHPPSPSRELAGHRIAQAPGRADDEDGGVGVAWCGHEEGLALRVSGASVREAFGRRQTAGEGLPRSAQAIRS